MSGRFLSGGSVVVTLLLLVVVARWEPSPGVRFPSQPGSSAGGASAPARVALAEAARALLPEGLQLQPASHGACLFEGHDAQGNPRWHAVFSKLAAPSLTGYAGPIELLTGIDGDGRVTGVRLLSHTETPTFVEGIDSDWFLGQFRGRSSGDPLGIGDDVDGITQATITVEAICRGIRACLAAIAPAHSPPPSGPTASAAVGVKGATGAAEMPGVPEPAGEKPWPLVALTLAVLLVLAAPAPLAAFGVGLLLGFGSGQYISLVHVQLLLRHPGQFWVFPLPVRVLLVLGLAAILLRPRGYCRWFCPLGRIQDTLWWLRGRMPSPRPSPMPSPQPSPPVNDRGEGDLVSPGSGGAAGDRREPPPSPTGHDRGEGDLRSPSPSGAAENRGESGPSPRPSPPVNDRGEGVSGAQAADTTLADTSRSEGSPNPVVTGDQDATAPLGGSSPADLPLPQGVGGEVGGEGEQPPPRESAHPRRGLGRLLFWGGLIGLLVDPRLPLERLEAFGPLFLRGFGPFGLVLALAALVGACLWPRFYCRGLCPLNPLFEDGEQVRQMLGGRNKP